VETKGEMEKALKETIIRVKQNSIEYREAHANPTDINAMMQFIKERKELQQLEKLHISIN
jgi:DNA primase